MCAETVSQNFYLLNGPGILPLNLPSHERKKMLELLFIDTILKYLTKVNASKSYLIIPGATILLCWVASCMMTLGPRTIRRGTITKCKIFKEVTPNFNPTYFFKFLILGWMSVMFNSGIKIVQYLFNGWKKLFNCRTKLSRWKLISKKITRLHNNVIKTGPKMETGPRFSSHILHPPVPRRMACVGCVGCVLYHTKLGKVMQDKGPFPNKLMTTLCCCALI